MRLVRCGLFVLAFVIGIQLFCVSLWRNPYLSVATMFSITLCLAALITWVGLKLVYWMVSEERRGTAGCWDMTSEFLHDMRQRFEFASAFGSYRIDYRLSEGRGPFLRRSE